MHAQTVITRVSGAFFARTLPPLFHNTMRYQPRVFHDSLTSSRQKGPCYTVVTYNLLAQKYIDAGWDYIPCMSRISATAATQNKPTDSAIKKACSVLLLQGSSLLSCRAQDLAEPVEPHPN